MNKPTRVAPEWTRRQKNDRNAKNRIARKARRSNR